MIRQWRGMPQNIERYVYLFFAFWIFLSPPKIWKQWTFCALYKCQYCRQRLIKIPKPVLTTTETTTRTRWGIRRNNLTQYICMDPVRVVGKGKQESVSKRKFLFGFYGWRYDLHSKTAYGQNSTFEWFSGDLSALYFIYFYKDGIF